MTLILLKPAVEDIIAGIAHCSGCGAHLQTRDPHKLGYLDVRAVDRLIEDSKKYVEVKKAMLQQYEKARKKKELNDNVDDIPALELKDLRVFERMKKRKPITCQRCHELKNYGGLVSSVDITAEDFYSKLSRLRERKDALIVLIMDLFNVEGSFIPRFDEIVGTENPVLVVGNKSDLLPTKANLPRIELWLRRYVTRHMPALARKEHNEEENAYDGIIAENSRSQIRDVMLVSSKSGHNIVALAHRIEKLRAGHRDVFIVGCTNVGKSTLINQLLTRFPEAKYDESGERIRYKPEDPENPVDEYDKLIDNLNNDRTPRNCLTTSILPGTTLRSVSFVMTTHDKRQSSTDKSIKVTKRRTNLFDTPGVINPYMVLNFLKSEDWKLVIPSRRITPHHYRLRPGRTLFLGGLVRIDYVSNNVPRDDWNFVFFTLFIASTLPVHTTSIDKASIIYNTHVGTKILSPPTLFGTHDGGELAARKDDDKENERNVHPLFGLNRRETLHLQGTTRRKSIADIVVPGVGWVAVTGVGNITIDVHVPEKLEVLTRNPLMPFETMFIRKDRYKDG